MQVYKEKEAEDFLEKEGFTVAGRMLAGKRTLVDVCNKIGYPVVLKVAEKLHKSDIGGVIVDVRNDREALNAYRKLERLSKKVLVQEFVAGECFLIGIKRDATFGHVLAFGLGGIYTELFKDISLRVCPVCRDDVVGMINETKASRLFNARGRRLNRKAVENILIKTGVMAKRYSCITELDINPLIVNEKRAVVVDARIVFG